MYGASLFEFVLFLAFFVLERIYPAHHFPLYRHWVKHWTLILVFASAWLMLLIKAWEIMPAPWQPLNEMSLLSQTLIAYLCYSFVGYWYHRLRHSWEFLWHYIHYMHHAPAHMDTRVTYWRHPVEIILDSIVVFAVGKLLGVEVEIIFYVLVIESSLQLFHHSNINTVKSLRWLGYFIQLPEQHLVHHQQGLHRWNYATLTFWDVIFGTLKIPDEWHGKVGLNEWNNTKRLLFFRY